MEEGSRERSLPSRERHGFSSTAMALCHSCTTRLHLRFWSLDEGFNCITGASLGRPRIGCVPPIRRRFSSLVDRGVLQEECRAYVVRKVMIFPSSVQHFSIPSAPAKPPLPSELSCCLVLDTSSPSDQTTLSDFSLPNLPAPCLP